MSWLLKLFANISTLFIGGDEMLVAIFTWLLIALGIMAIVALMVILLGALVSLAGGLVYLAADIIVALLPIILIVWLIKRSRKKKENEDPE